MILFLVLQWLWLLKRSCLDLVRKLLTDYLTYFDKLITSTSADVSVPRPYHYYYFTGFSL